MHGFEKESLENHIDQLKSLSLWKFNTPDPVEVCQFQ